MKVIKITTEKSVYHLSLEFVAKHRAKYYKDDNSTTEQEEIDFLMNDDYEGIDWLSNNMDYEDFKDELVRIKDVEVEEDFANAEKEIEDITNLK